MTRKKLPAPEDDHDRAILGDIRRVGWSVIQIERENEGDPLYSFSLGMLHSHGHPEIILLGLSHQVAGQIINDIGAAVAAGQHIETGRKYDDFASVPVAFVTMNPAHYKEYVGYALWLYGGPDFPILQCVWPLKSGHFPWDKGYPKDGAAVQPLLGQGTVLAKPNWPFDDPPNVATISVRQIIHGGEPILLVSHDADDCGWQFLTGGAFKVADGMVVCLREIFERDPSIAELADLELGWQATRKRVGSPWHRTARSEK